MRVTFYILLLILFFSSVMFGDKKIRKDQYCKESLFLQMLSNKCTPRNFIYEKKKSESI